MRISGFWKCAEKFYMPVLNDTLSVCKVTQFENLLRIWNKEKILEKTEKVHLPFIWIGSLLMLT